MGLKILGIAVAILTWAGIALPLAAQPAVGVHPPSARPGDAFKDCDACPEMVVVPAGSFTMGSPPGEDGRFAEEGPQHAVTIPRPFAVGKFELTFAEWDACADDGGCGGYRPSDLGWGRDRRPVIHVSWEAARRYVEWLSRKTGQRYRLLSEAEWEYAARAGTTTARPWGDDIGSGNANCDGCGSQWGGKQTAPVGSFGANRFGLHDMLGNLWEWTEDCWNFGYDGAPSDGGAWTSGDCRLRVLRGGSWLRDPRYLRSASRYRSAAVNRYYVYGFRVARTL